MIVLDAENMKTVISACSSTLKEERGIKRSHEWIIMFVLNYWLFVLSSIKVNYWINKQLLCWQTTFPYSSLQLGWLQTQQQAR